jgi:uncharacterized protein
MSQYEDTHQIVMPAKEEMAIDQGLKRFLLGIYQKMALGLLVTGILAFVAANTPAVTSLLYTMQDGYITGYTTLGIVMAFAPLGLSLASGLFMNGLNAAVSGAFYWVFVAIMGVSLSSIALIYTGGSIASIFLITAAAFGALSLFGYTTKVNMSGWGSFLIMGVFGMIGVGLVNFIWLKSPMIEIVLASVGVLIFSGLIAYKTQSLKLMYYELGGASESRLAAMTYLGALNLYISFINLFLSLLRLFGARR